MSSESLDYRPSRKEPLDLESRDSSDTFEKNSLLGNRGSVPKMNKRTSWTSRPTCALLCSCIILIASTVIWSRVTFQLTKFSYDVREEDNFEPKWRFSSCATFQPHHFYGGPPTNDTNEMWRMLEPPRGGIVTIPKEYTTDLHPSLEDSENPNNLIYGVSMFH